MYIYIYTKLDQYISSDSNENCTTFFDSVTSTKIKHMQKINKRKNKIENWMTDELLNPINQKDYLYVHWKYKSKSVDFYNISKYERIEYKIYKKQQKSVLL